jgi:hypothetical protein
MPSGQERCERLSVYQVVTLLLNQLGARGRKPPSLSDFTKLMKFRKEILPECTKMCERGNKKKSAYIPWGELIASGDLVNMI